MASQVLANAPSNGIKSASVEERIYHTTYKKGFIVGNLHFKFPGDLPLAVEAVKGFLARRHLKHIHTVPFLINLNDEEAEQIGLPLE